MAIGSVIVTISQEVCNTNFQRFDDPQKVHRGRKKRKLAFTPSNYSTDAPIFPRQWSFSVRQVLPTVFAGHDEPQIKDAPM